LSANQLQLQKVSLQATNAADIIMAIITAKTIMPTCATTAARSIMQLQLHAKHSLPIGS
jgi:hypothetical protein